MILTLLASGPILSCLCVAPFKAPSPATQNGGYAPVIIQIEQIQPLRGQKDLPEVDLQAEEPTVDGDETGGAPAIEPSNGEVMIRTTPPEIKGSIPLPSFHGPKRAAARINGIAEKAQLALAAKAPTKPVASESKTLAPTSEKAAVGTDPAGDVPENTTPALKSGQIEGIYVCSFVPASDALTKIQSEVPEVSAEIAAPTTGLGNPLKSQKHSRWQAVVIHGPPEAVEMALAVARQQDVRAKGLLTPNRH